MQFVVTRKLRICPTPSQFLWLPSNTNNLGKKQCCSFFVETLRNAKNTHLDVIIRVLSMAPCSLPANNPHETLRSPARISLAN